MRGNQNHKYKDEIHDQLARIGQVISSPKRLEIRKVFIEISWLRIP